MQSGSRFSRREPEPWNLALHGSVSSLPRVDWLVLVAIEDVLLDGEAILLPGSLGAARRRRSPAASMVVSEKPYFSLCSMRSSRMWEMSRNTNMVVKPRSKLRPAIILWIRTATPPPSAWDHTSWWGLPQRLLRRHASQGGICQTIC
jgi:hypothetical protein